MLISRAHAKPEHPSRPDPLCVGIPATRDDSRVLSHADAAAIAYEVPYDRYPAPGSRGLPLPRTTVEAMTMIAYARQQGVTAFWAASPNTQSGDVRMVRAAQTQTPRLRS